MSLNWNIGECAESPEVLWSDERRAKTEYLIFATMTVGIGKWTAANIGEVYARLHLVEKIEGAPFSRIENDKRVDVYTTPEEVRALIGLGTNVSYETRAKFLRRWVTDKRMGCLDRWSQKATEKAAA